MCSMMWPGFVSLKSQSVHSCQLVPTKSIVSVIDMTKTLLVFLSFPDLLRTCDPASDTPAKVCKNVFLTLMLNHDSLFYSVLSANIYWNVSKKKTRLSAESSLSGLNFLFVTTRERITRSGSIWNIGLFGKFPGESNKTLDFFYQNTLFFWDVMYDYVAPGLSFEKSTEPPQFQMCQ